MPSYTLNMQTDKALTKSAETPWKGLYIVAGAAALLSAAFFLIQIAVFFISPPPDSVIGWFTLFQKSKLIGLLNLDLLLMIDEALVILIFLALYAALQRTHASLITIGTAFGLLSATLLIASNPAFQMLSLSEQYAAAVTEAQRAALLAAGQATLAMWEGSAFQASYLLGSIAAILISAVMLRSRHFSMATAYLGILANAIALGLYVPVIGVYISILSVVFLWIWYLLLARDLFRLARPA